MSPVTKWVKIICSQKRYLGAIMGSCVICSLFCEVDP